MRRVVGVTLFSQLGARGAGPSAVAAQPGPAPGFQPVHLLAPTAPSAPAADAGPRLEPELRTPTGPTSSLPWAARRPGTGTAVARAPRRGPAVTGSL